MPPKNKIPPSRSKAAPPKTAPRAQAKPAQRPAAPPARAPAPAKTAPPQRPPQTVEHPKPMGRSVPTPPQPQRAPAPANAAPPPQAPRQVNAPPRQAPPNTTPTVALAQVAPTNSAIVPGAPAWLAKEMQKHGARGLELVDRDDLIMPRLLLAQGQTKAVQAGAINVGDIADNISNEVLAPRGTALEIIPIALTKSRIYFGDMDAGEGILCRSDDAITARPNGIGQNQGGEYTRNCGECIHKEWNDSADAEVSAAPACSGVYNILCLIPSRGYAPYVWSLRSTGIKVAKRFLSAVKQTGADFFAHKFTIWSEQQSDAQNTWQNFNFASNGWVEEAEYKRAEAFFSSLEGKRWEVDMSDVEEGAQTSEEFAPAEEPAETGDFEDVPQDAEFAPAEEGAAEEPPPPGDADAPADDDVAF